MSRILIVGPAHPYRGGIAAFNELLARAFQKSGDEVDLLSFRLQYPSFLFPGKTQYTEAAKPDDLNIFTEINSVNPANWIKVGRKYKKRNYDIIIIRYWMPFMGPALGTIGRILKKNKHSKIIAITDNIIPHEKRIGDTAFTKYFVNMCDGFVTLSLSVLEELKSFTDKPAIYNPHPIYDNYGELMPKKEARKALGLEENGAYILFFGLVRQYKGLDILLEAMDDVRLKNHDIKLLVTGEFYDDETVYHELIEKFGIKDAVIINNKFIPDEDVAKYFCACDLVVQPYKTASQSGISQIAYHFNKPMVVTKVGGLPEIVPDGKVGFVTEVSPGAVANAINMFYEKGLENQFVENVKEEKKRFAWSKLVDEIKVLAAKV